MLLLLSHFSRVQLCATPSTAAHQAPPSLGFSRQEHWSGLPLPSPMNESEKWKWSHWVMFNFQRPHGLQPTRLLCPWDFPGNSTGVGWHCLLLTSLQSSISKIKPLLNPNYISSHHYLFLFMILFSFWSPNPILPMMPTKSVSTAAWSSVTSHQGHFGLLNILICEWF